MHTESRPGADALSEATVKLQARGKRYVITGEGNGPVNAMDAALRLAITEAYPVVERFELIDYRVRILDSSKGTDATIRVLIESTDGEESWETVGVGENIVEASWEALVDSIVYGLVRHHGDRDVLGGPGAAGSTRHANTSGPEPSAVAAPAPATADVTA